MKKETIFNSMHTVIIMVIVADFFWKVDVSHWIGFQRYAFSAILGFFIGLVFGAIWEFAEVESGVFALYSGDINQDGVIDQDDLSILNNAIENGLFGIQIADLNGDGAVDTSDTDNFYANLGKTVMRP